MTIRQIMIDGTLAQDAELIAEVLGYESLEHYVMDLIAQDIQEKLDAVRMNQSEETIMEYMEEQIEEGRTEW